jgi:hypothetical protein
VIYMCGDGPLVGHKVAEAVDDGLALPHDVDAGEVLGLGVPLRALHLLQTTASLFEPGLTTELRRLRPRALCYILSFPMPCPSPTSRCCLPPWRTGGHHGLRIRSGAMAREGEVAPTGGTAGRDDHRCWWRRRQRSLSAAASGGCWKPRLPVVWASRDPSSVLGVCTGELLEKGQTESNDCLFCRPKGKKRKMSEEDTDLETDRDGRRTRQRVEAVVLPSQITATWSEQSLGIGTTFHSCVRLPREKAAMTRARINNDCGIP